MKILTILFMLCAGVSFSQVGQVESVPDYKTIGVANENRFPKLELNTESNRYLLTYINEKYRSLNEIESLSFTAKDSDLDRLYQTIKEQYSSSETKSLTLGNDLIYLSSKEDRVTVLVMSPNGLSSYFFIFRDELDKLFGKV